MALGQAGVDRRGLWINDTDQGWGLRVGEVSTEIFASGAEGMINNDDFAALDQWNEDMAATGPVFGFFFTKDF